MRSLLPLLALLAANSGDDLFGNRPGHFLVRVELHRVRRAALGGRTEVGSISEHLGEWDLCGHHLCVAALLHTAHLAAAARKVAGDGAHVVAGGGDLDVDDRLEDLWRRLGYRLAIRRLGRDFERKRG